MSSGCHENAPDDTVEKGGVWQNFTYRSNLVDGWGLVGNHPPNRSRLVRSTLEKIPLRVLGPGEVRETGDWDGRPEASLHCDSHEGGGMCLRALRSTCKTKNPKKTALTSKENRPSKAEWLW